MWRVRSKGGVSIGEIASFQSLSRPSLLFLLWRMKRSGWIAWNRDEHIFKLTGDGVYRAANIVRLHRLWEVYLAHYLGVGGEKVHRNAEEMEHILTPELEKELTLLLQDPKEDPHQQPIPSRGG